MLTNQPGLVFHLLAAVQLISSWRVAKRARRHGVDDKARTFPPRSHATSQHCGSIGGCWGVWD
jgi:hypothetical protein